MSDGAIDFTRIQQQVVLRDGRERERMEVVVDANPGSYLQGTCEFMCPDQEILQYVC
jgi:hypothetical protein